MGVRNREISPFYISHPVTLFMYYVALFSCIFIFKNPLFALTAFIACCLMAMYYAGLDKFLQSLKWVLVIGVFVLALNVLLVHRGSTVITYLFYNPITKEAVIYGVYNMFMIMSVIIAFVSFNTLLDSSRFLYIFSNILPKTSFLFDMSLRYMPLLRKRATDLAAVQSINRPSKDNNIRQKITTSGTYLKALTAWTLEEGMQTALSLKVKNYGTRRKTPYTRFRYTIRDILLLVAFLGVLLFVYISAFMGQTEFEFYPVTSSIVPRGFTLVLYFIMAFAIFLPFILEAYMAIKRGIIKTCLKKH